MVVVGSGTGGTVTGIARKLKEKCPECKVSWAAGLPAGSCVSLGFPACDWIKPNPMAHLSEPLWSSPMCFSTASLTLVGSNLPLQKPPCSMVDTSHRCSFCRVCDSKQTGGLAVTAPLRSQCVRDT